MSDPDPANAIKTAYVGWLAAEYPTCSAVLEADQGYRPTDAAQQLLVADDGGGRLASTSWALRKTPLRITIRVTAFARGRTLARQIADDAADWIIAHRPAGISRIEDISALLVTKDRDTGAYLASFTMPVIVRPTT